MKEKMKLKIKRLLSIAAAVAMVLGIAGSYTAPVVAANDGSITIQNTTKNATYNIYKIFDATYDGNHVAYTYDGSNSTFLDNLRADTSPFTVTGTSAPYTIGEKAGKSDSDILKFIKENGPQSGTNNGTTTWTGGNFGGAVKSLTGNGESVSATGLAYGYYFITTTTGATVTIDTAAKDANIIDKNESIPIPQKTESNNRLNVHDVKSLTAHIGDTVDYKVTGTIARYVELNGSPQAVLNLTFRDTLSDGLTGVTGSLAIKVKDPDTNVETTLNKGTDYTYNQTGKSLDIKLITATLDNANAPQFKYKAGTQYTITYQATVNSSAVIGNPAREEDRNDNIIDLKFNNEIEIGTDRTVVNTYEIGMTKVNSSGATLPGAEFKLYDSKTEGNIIPVVFVETSSSGTNIYRHALADEKGVDHMTVGSNGALVIRGLSNGSYYFEETKAPDGYNPLTERTEAIVIDNDNKDVSITNQAGSVLPSTGGVGTTIFYAVGIVLIAGAGILLVVRRKKNA